MKTVIIVLLVAVLLALAGAGVFMLRKDGQTEEARDRRMARALAWRVGLSITLFVLVLLAWWLGWLQPSGLPVGR